MGGMRSFWGRNLVLRQILVIGENRDPEQFRDVGWNRGLGWFLGG